MTQPLSGGSPPPSDEKATGAPITSLVIAGSGISGSGCALPLLIIGAIFVGRWIDRQLGTEPLAVLFLILTSIGASILFVFWLALESGRDAQRDVHRVQRGTRTKTNGPLTEEHPRSPHEEEHH